MVHDTENILPTGWTESSIGQVTLPVLKIDPNDHPDQEVDYIDISSIDNTCNLIENVNVKQYRLRNAPSRARQIVRAGDVIFATVRPYLRNIARVPDEYDQQIASTGFSVLRPAKGVCSAFLYYKAISRDLVNALSEMQYGVSYPAVKDEQVRGQPLWLPPTAEQHRIVAKIEELFSELDKGVESLKTARAQLNVYRQSVLKHAFEGKLTAKWREENRDKLEKPEQLLARIKQERAARYEQQLQEWKAAVKGWEESGKPGKRPPRPRIPLKIADVPDDVIAILPDLPDCWRWVRVRDCCEVVRGGSPRPAGDTRYYDGTIPFLKVADLTRTKGAYLDTHYFSIKEAGLQKTRLVDPPILMLSNSGATLGIPKVCRIKTTFNDGIAAFLGLDPDDLLYHYYFWTSKTLQLRAINQGAAQPNLNTDLIKETLIPLCTHEEMRIVAKHVGRLLSMCDNLIAGIESQLIRSNALRQSILRQAVGGQLVAQDPKDEPASVLLDRIRAEREQAVKNNIPGKTKKRAAA